MLNKILGILLLFLSSAILSGCSLNDEEIQQIEFEVELNLITTIDEFPELNPPWIVNPATVIAYKNGFVFTDSQHKRIHLLQKDGSLKTAFGREGRGPGELLGVNFAYVMDQKILIPDINNARTSTFDHSGNFLRHVMHESQHPIVTGRVHSWKENRNLTASYAMNFGNCIFFELDENAQITKDCFGDYEALEYSDIELLKHIGRNGGVGDIHFINSDSFIFAPAFYYGVNYVYVWNDDTWVQESTIEGFSYNEVAAIKSNEYKQEPGYFSIQYSGSDAMIARILSRSYGYYPIGDYLLHITQQIVENDNITIIELFTQDGVYLGHKIQDFPISPQGKYGMSVFENYYAIATSLDLDIYEININFDK